MNTTETQDVATVTPDGFRIVRLSPGFAVERGTFRKVVGGWREAVAVVRVEREAAAVTR